MIDAGGYKVKNEDIFDDGLVPYLTELFDTKQHDTDYINSFIEVVPFLNQENMADFLLANGYTAFDIDDSSKNLHTNIGFYYVLKAVACLSTFVPTGQM